MDPAAFARLAGNQTLSLSVSVQRSQQVGEIRPVAVAAKRRVKRRDVPIWAMGGQLGCLALQAAKADRWLCKG